MSLSKIEREHPTGVSRAKWLFIILCMVAIVATYVRNESQTGSVNERVTKIESPCLKYGSHSHQCEEAFEAAVAGLNHREACFIARKAGIVEAIREDTEHTGSPFKDPCANADLKVPGLALPRSPKRAAAGGGGAQNSPSNKGTQTPGPRGGGHHSGSHPHPSHPAGGGGNGGGQGSPGGGSGGGGGGESTPPDNGGGQGEGQGGGNGVGVSVPGVVEIEAEVCVEAGRVRVAC